MSAVNFTRPADEGAGMWGRPPEPVPEQLAALLERTYRDGVHAEMQIPADDQPEWLRLCRLHAKRQGKTIQAYTFTDDDERPWLAFRMKDKRTYTRRQENS